MRNLFFAAALTGAALAATEAAASDPVWLFPTNDSTMPITIAVFGDWPYSQVLLDNAGRLTGSVNADPDVSLVLHVGDIHSGSMPCTSAGILPPIATADPGWNQKVYYQFQQFAAPVVYTPGDNEWSDCHKSKEKSAGAPLEELAAVRSLFFARPGHTLGLADMTVLSQARFFDPAFPGDAAYVENVVWMDEKVVFVTINMPGGSNNDTAPWSAPFSDPDAQSAEVAARTGADMRWLQSAFDLAARNHARAVVIGLQADLWDPEQTAAGGAGLDQYTPFVQELADTTVAFGRPVLLINGDTHLYEADHPLADPQSTTGVIHHAQAVPNLTRITVQGSTNGPAEWLRLTIDTRREQPFSWTNVPYCTDPTTSCD
jgi:Calcineurin-like phosphoesterase